MLTLAELRVSAFPLDTGLPPNSLSDLPYLACSHQITVTLRSAEDVLCLLIQLLIKKLKEYLLHY